MICEDKNQILAYLKKKNVYPETSKPVGSCPDEEKLYFHSKTRDSETTRFNKPW